MEDLVSNVWLELCNHDLKRLKYYDPDRGQFGFFIRMQASQIAWSVVTRQLGRPELSQETVPEPTDDGLERRLLSRDLLERLADLAHDRLSESDWVLLNALYIEGLSSDEVAERLNKRVKTVYQQKHRLMQKLAALAREFLTDEKRDADSSDPLTPLIVASLITTMINTATTDVSIRGPSLYNQDDDTIKSSP